MSTAGFAALNDGADAVYACMSIPFIEAMSNEGIPVVGHVGLVPQKRTWRNSWKINPECINRDNMKETA